MSSFETSSSRYIALTSGDSADDSQIWMTLFKKEMKVVFSLLSALLAIGVIYAGINVVGNNLAQGRDDQSFVYLSQTLFALLLGFYVMAASPLVIGAERENRTLHWLISLPIRMGQIVTSKIAAILVGYATTFLIGVMILFIARWGYQGDAKLSVESYLVIKLNSVLMFCLLVQGIVFAWGAANVWRGIAYQMVSAGIMAGMCAIVEPYRIDSNGKYFLVVTIAWIGFTFLVVCLGWKPAKRAFLLGRQSSAASYSRFDVITEALAKSERTHGNRLLWHVRSERKALLWQAYKQNKMVVLFSGVALALLVVLALRQAAVTVSTDPSYSAGAICGLLFLPVVWMGGASFASEKVNNRIRYLSDRGVSPWTVWWTRLAPGAASLFLVMAALMLVGAMDWISLFHRHWSINASRSFLHWNDAAYRSRHLLTIGYLGFVAYGIGAWVAQVARSPIVSSCLGPLVCLPTVIYIALTNHLIHRDIFGLLPFLFLPYVATCLMMRPWMEGIIGWREKSLHAGVFALMIAIPWIPFAYVWARYPAVSNEVAQKIAEHVKSAGSSNANSPANASDQEIWSEFEERMLSPVMLDKLKEKLSSDEVVSRSPIYPPLRAKIYDYIEDARHEFELMPENSRASSAFVSALEVLFLLSKIDRAGNDLLSQEYADRSDFWLVNALDNPTVRKIVGSEEYDNWVRYLSDKQERDAARRRSLVLSKHAHGSKTMLIGSIEVPNRIPENYGALTRSIAEERDRDIALGTLLDYLDSGRSNAQQKAFERYRDFWFPGTHTLPEYSSRSRLSLLSNATVPGLLWNGSWEVRASNLDRSEDPVQP